MRIPPNIVLLLGLFTSAASLLRAQPTPEPLRILVVFGHDPNAPGVVIFQQAAFPVIRAGMPGPVEFYSEFLDADRFSGPEREAQMRRYFVEKYKAIQFDAILTEGTRALRFTTEHLSDAFPDVAIVYGMAFEPPFDFSELPALVTGRIMPLPFAATFQMARRLQPDAEHVVLVGGASKRDSLMLSEGVRQMTPLLGSMKLTVLQNWSLESLLESLRRTPPRAFVVLSGFQRDQLGREFNSGDLIPSVTRVASVPVYGIARNWVGDGIVGGAVMDFREDGLQTGRLVVDVLRRGAGERMPPAETANTPALVDWRQLQRWGLSERDVPPQAQILFRTPTAWERYRITILIALGVIAAQSLLLMRLLMERRQRIKAQRAIARQTSYEHMIAELTTDAVRLAPDRSADALQHALARMAIYADARFAVLDISADVLGRGEQRMTWGRMKEVRHAAAQSTSPVHSDSCLRMPLVVGDHVLGQLELHRDSACPAQLVVQLDGAAEIIAGALARARSLRALEESQGQVVHMARVATVGQLAAAVSHELKQPLTAIRANAEAGALILAQATPDVSEAREIFQDIVNVDARAADILEHMRDLLRKEASNRGDVDINEICRRALQLLRPDAAARRVRLVGSYDPAIPKTSGDAVQLQQVILNLTLNGIDSATNSKNERLVTVSTRALTADIEICVQDTGSGLSSTAQQRLFEPFYSTKQKGLGMGLSIVRAIVERHGGRVRGESNAGGGAVFTVELPVK